MSAPDEHVNAVVRVMREHSHTVPDPARSTPSWISWMCQCGGSIRGGHSAHIARAILYSLDATPAQSDAPDLLAALQSSIDSARAARKADR